MLAQKLIGASAASPPLEVEYIATYTGTTSSSQSITGVSFGAEDVTRRIYVLVGFFGSERDANSMTIGGVSATLLAMQRAELSNGYALFVADVPTGTSGTVSVVFSGSLSTPTPRFFVYRALNQTEALATVLLDTGNSSSASTTSRSVTNDTASGGFALALIKVISARVFTFNIPQSTTASENIVAGLLVPTTGSSTTFTVSWTTSTRATFSVFSLKM